MDCRSILFAALFVIAAPQPAAARTWHVLSDGSGDAPTVQAGIDAAAVGDTILVGPGTYLENINFLGKDIVVRSQAGPEATILDGSGAPESVVLFINGESRSAVLEGFTLTGGRGHREGNLLPKGGGVYCGEASPTIRENRIIQNRITESRGGGIFLVLPDLSAEIATPLIEGNLFEENSAYNGGAIAADGGIPVIRGNIFRRNECRYDGGAIFVWMFRGSAVIEHNQFWENIAPDHGGAIYAGNTYQADFVTIQNNLFVRNRADGVGNGETGSGGAIWLAYFSGSVSNNTMVGNLGYGELPCSGSGILLNGTPIDLEVRDNIIALGNECGIECLNLFRSVETVPGPNILWGNTGYDILYSVNHCPPEWEPNILIVDPQFCGPEVDNYTVSVDSPALTGGAPFGVWTTPGCGPGVPVKPTTWGRIKALYR